MKSSYVYHVLVLRTLGERPESEESLAVSNHQNRLEIIRNCWIHLEIWKSKNLEIIRRFRFEQLATNAPLISVFQLILLSDGKVSVCFASPFLRLALIDCDPTFRRAALQPLDSNVKVTFSLQIHTRLNPTE